MRVDVYLDDFWLRFGFRATGISVFEEILFLGLFLALMLLRLEGGRFGGIIWGGFWRRGSNIPRIIMGP